MRRLSWMATWVCFAVGALLTVNAGSLEACQLCSVVVGTLSDQIDEATAVVIAYHAAAKDRPVAGSAPQKRATFRVANVLKGGVAGKQWTLPSAAGKPTDKPLMLFAFGAVDDLQWSAPELLSDEAQQYLEGFALHESTTDRLRYRLPFLVAKDRFVFDDAYNELLGLVTTRYRPCGSTLTGLGSCSTWIACWLIQKRIPTASG